MPNAPPTTNVAEEPPKPKSYRVELFCVIILLIVVILGIIFATALKTIRVENDFAYYTIARIGWAIVTFLVLRLMYYSAAYFMTDVKVSKTLYAAIDLPPLLLAIAWVILQYFSTPFFVANVAASRVDMRLMECLIYVLCLRGAKVIFVKTFLLRVNRDRFTARIADALRKNNIATSLIGKKRLKSPRGPPEVVEHKYNHRRRALTKMLTLPGQGDQLSILTKARQYTMADVPELSESIVRRIDTEEKGYFTREELVLDGSLTNTDDIAYLYKYLSTVGNADVPSIAAYLKSVIKEQRSLKASFHDNEHVALLFSTVMNIPFAIVSFFVILYTFRVDVSATLVPVGSSLLALTFVFGGSIKQTWENFILIFIVRPFDVGDYIFCPNATEVAITVSAVYLMTTEGISKDGRHWIIPNSILGASSLLQHTRSKFYLMKIMSIVDFSTPPALIDQLTASLREFIATDTSIAWGPELFFHVISTSNTNAIELRYIVEIPTITWGQPKLISDANSVFINALRERCLKFGIKYSAIPLPVSVTQKPTSPFVEDPLAAVLQSHDDFSTTYSSDTAPGRPFN